MRRALFLLAALAGCSGAPLQSDWEREHVATLVDEEQVTLPRYPREADLLAFDPGVASGFRFLLDGSTLSVGRDGIVRYALVARSPQGVDNVSYEGMRCATREFRIYAVGREDRTWASRPGPWQTLRGGSPEPARRVLEHGYLCPQGRPAYGADEVVAALRNRRGPGGTSD